MAQFVKVGAVADFPEGRGRPVTVEGIKVGVFKLAGRIYAVKDACPHMGASLADGRLDGRRVICHWHGWIFDLETGRSEQSQWACAKIYEVNVRGGDVYLRAPEEPPLPEPEEEEWVPFDPDKHLKKNS